MLGTHTCRNGSCFKRLDLPVAPYSCVLSRTPRKHNFPIRLVRRPYGSLNKSKMGNLCLNSLTSATARFSLLHPSSWRLHVVTRDKSSNLLSCVKSQGGIDIMPFPTDPALLSGFTAQGLERSVEGNSFTLLLQSHWYTPILSCLLI